MLWQLRCHCNPDHDKFSSTVVAIFPNVCLWRRSLCSNLALTLKNCIEPPLYASTAYVVAIWPSFLFNSSVKVWDTCEIFFGQMVYRPSPPGKKFPVRLCLSALTSRFLRTLQQNRAQSKLLYLLYDKESDKISTRCFLIFKTNYWHMAWQLQLRVLYSHKARFVNQPKSELYLNFLILNICIP